MFNRIAKLRGRLMSKRQNIRVKICLVGDSGVGKTSLISRLIYGDFDDRYIPTSSTLVSQIEYGFPEIDGFEITLEMDLWDISGQKGFLRFLKDDYFRKATLILGVCDVSRKKTLYALWEWIKVGLEIAGDIPVRVLGNKVDLGRNLVEYDPALKKLINEFDASLYYVSARTGLNVEYSFQEIAASLLEDILKGLFEEEEVRGFEWDILDAISKRGRYGASKEILFKSVKGIGFDTLFANIESLERKGYLKVNWNGASNFLAVITKKGIEKLEQGPKKYYDESIDLVVT